LDIQSELIELNGVRIDVVCDEAVAANADEMVAAAGMADPVLAVGGTGVEAEIEPAEDLYPAVLN